MKRFRVVLGTMIVVALGALLTIATCGDERVADPARRGASRVATAAGADAAPDAGPDADAPRDRVAAPAAVRRLPRRRAAPPEPAPPVIEESWFHDPVEQWETEKRIDLSGAQPGVLVAKWIDMADSGVELERRSGGKTLWRVHVEPLGIEHSKYHQEVTVRAEDDRVVVESVGAQKILEIRELATGAQTSREVTDVVR